MPKDTASSQVWTVGKLVQAIDGSPSIRTRVVIPKFQRRLVWKEEQRLALIESIYRGYPIGAILLSKRPADANGTEVFQVVDGLQRTSTLVRYTREPLAWAPADLVPANATAAIASALDVKEDSLAKSILDWLRSTRETRFSAGFSPKRLWQRICDDFSIDGARLDLVESLIEELLDDVKTNVDITGLSIPVVTYSGPESELPEIFERINQSGTKLSKYEVFAATWLNESGTQIGSSEIRTAINEKYATLIERGFAIDGLEHDESIRDYNLFEYLFGFGKVLVKNHPLLFAERPDPAETEPAAFSLSCVVRGQQLALMHDLPRFMPVASDGVIDPSAMESALRKSAEAVESWLRPYISLRLNSAPGNGLDFAHGELQIVSMIARAAVGRWNTRDDWSEVQGWERDWELLKKAMPQHYLVDLLEETWRGPIYSTVFNRVWSTNDEGEILRPSPHYSTAIPRRVFEDTVDSWFDWQLQREQRSRPYVRAVDRTFLRYLYSDIVTHKKNTGEQFELEHLFPVSRLKNIISASGGPGWPISSIANLALFTKALNREKSALTISEYLGRANLNEQEKATVLDYLLCDPDDVAIDDASLTREQYVDFLVMRWTEIRRVLSETLNIGM